VPPAHPLRKIDLSVKTLCKPGIASGKLLIKQIIKYLKKKKLI